MNTNESNRTADKSAKPAQNENQKQRAAPPVKAPGEQQQAKPKS